ncbi:MAG: hypothetical protein K0U86_14630 [Planctomycetes bacterium]|nr:hypothetical protein [Planctomycetota bacterium]MCH9726132.1 hypothetical protein [Planctomycetota bacterium]MDF1747193.1 hypothetical protein [Gimesia sp.]
MQFKHSGMGILLAVVCLSSSCSESDEQNLIGRWQTTAGPNMIFNQDGTVYSINRGPRRKGRYYLNTETKPYTLIMDMRKSTINAVLYFDYAPFSAKHIELTPRFVQRTGEKKKESDSHRKMLYKKINPNDPTAGQKRIAVRATPETT